MAHYPWTDPPPASDALVCVFRDYHSRSQEVVRYDGPPKWLCHCGAVWPCPAAAVLVRLDAAEADRDRWKARAEAAEESLVDGLRSVAADDRHARFAPDPHLCAPCEAARLLAIYRERLTPDPSGPVEGGE